MRRTTRTDANQAEIVRAFKALGCLVHDTSALGGGFPDLVVLAYGRPWLVEVKDGSKPPSARKFTPDQVAFQQRGWLVSTVTSVDDVIALMTAMRPRASA